MALIQSFEKTGNFLFKFRGQIPAIIFVLSMPFLYFTDYQWMYRCPPSDYHAFHLTLISMAILISSLGFIIRCYTIGTTPRGTSGRNTNKQVANLLNTTGIYSMVRHPLYLGNYLMWAGLLFFTMNIPVILIVSLIFWIYYERIMFAEEAYLTRQFGDEFVDWSMGVPAFIPALRKFKRSNVPFSFKTVLRREYTGLFSMVFAYTLTDYWIKMTINWRTYGNLQHMDWVRPSLYVLGSTLIILLVLRTLKHHTSLLNRSENRD
ncbi:isoprenylcysteine carboxylmethyltransferase family protein [Bacteroidales bacterium OttesenSCG-928-B11]|nr:isoprenylcysteine carboxylmethyltransferase family protein [Bacteroidales bacterium OttesenSCG-928-E04]MDL2308444.1 isoprenylcysteine carboxylmethyltransferase family protein [Bacteroidales bacterium OttesenSCG-928-C03]MDL2311309.1 isoprenylcysteine carboxylmethyltransferase family protein [Bacteroidales bacterium OttesenSCG-928-B11]MDL2326035.1 isoprenylcysteine carboxylmethyltransferase family protein [Bacteroidales bacterium OttesenSCG-928-A14]